jgi:hypothetical protein
VPSSDQVPPAGPTESGEVSGFDRQSRGDSERAGAEFGGYYYDHDCGQPYERNEHWLGFFHGVAERIVSDLAPTSVLDAGCAWGLLVEALRKEDVEAWGVDISDYAISQVDEAIREFCWQASLTEPLPRRYDLVTCVEVIEHMPARDADIAIANLCEATDRVLFSSSPHDYSEPTHVNVKQPEEWAVMFARHGFVRDLDFDGSFLTDWAVLFRRTDAPALDTIRDYERRVWRLQTEIREVRGTVLDLQDRLASAWSSESVRLKEELLAARDAVIGHEAALGEALGRVRELEAQLSRYEEEEQDFDAIVRSRPYRILRLAQRLLRPLRSS